MKIPLNGIQSGFRVYVKQIVNYSCSTTMNAHAAVLFEFCADDANTPIHCASWVSDLAFLLSGTNFIRFFYN
jgi:hypothetical protein